MKDCVKPKTVTFTTFGVDIAGNITAALGDGTKLSLAMEVVYRQEFCLYPEKRLAQLNERLAVRAAALISSLPNNSEVVLRKSMLETSLLASAKEVIPSVLVVNLATKSISRN